MSAIVGRALNDTLGTSDFKGLNYYLERIADAISAQYTFESFEDIKKAVQFGIAAKAFPVGAQLTIEHTAVTDVWDVVAHDKFKIPGNPTAHTMTLMMHEANASLNFSKKQAFYYARNGLVAGDYAFTVAEGYGDLTAGRYIFTLTNPVPEGGQLVLTSATVIKTYSSSTSNNPIEGAELENGQGGQHLGTLGVGDLNAVQRAMNGSDNYKESALRQWLNSNDVNFTWTPQTIFDRPPDISGSGFLYGLDSEAKAVITPVEVHCSTNSTYSAPGSTTPKNTKYVLTDKVYLASATEIGGQNGIADDSILLDFFKNAPSSRRIKYDYSTPVEWFTRSVSSSPWSKSSRIASVWPDGSMSNSESEANLSKGIVPMITIG